MGEYGNEQRNQLTKVINHSESKKSQLKRFVDNRYQTVSQTKLVNSILKKSNSCLSNITQRRVLSLGGVDNEVKYAQKWLAQTVNQETKKFEDVEEIKSSEAEYLVGHGSSTKIGQMDSTVFKNELAKKMNKLDAYDLKIMACNTGQTKDGIDPIAKVVHVELIKDGYKIKITAPKDQLHIVAPGQIITGNLPLDTEKVDTNYYFDRRREIVNSFMEKLEKSSTSISWKQLLQVLTKMREIKDFVKVPSIPKLKDNECKSAFINLIKSLFDYTGKTSKSNLAIVKFVININIYPDDVSSVETYEQFVDRIEEILLKDYKYCNAYKNASQTDKFTTVPLEQGESEKWDVYNLVIH